MFISRGRNTGIHHLFEVTSVEESSKEKFFNLRSSNSATPCISIIVKESVLIHMRFNMTMFHILLIIV